MLTEIYCEAFGEQQRVPFFSGLNVIQGISDESDGNGNSIGKTNMPRKSILPPKRKSGRMVT